MAVYTYDPPERFIAGTVGQPGERTFYLQASGNGRVTSVALEKVQVSRLAERLDELLDDELRSGGGKASAVTAARGAAMTRGWSGLLGWASIVGSTPGIPGCTRLARQRMGRTPRSHRPAGVRPVRP